MGQRIIDESEEELRAQAFVRGGSAASNKLKGGKRPSQVSSPDWLDQKWQAYQEAEESRSPGFLKERLTIPQALSQISEYYRAAEEQNTQLYLFMRGDTLYYLGAENEGDSAFVSIPAELRLKYQLRSDSKTPTTASHLETVDFDYVQAHQERSDRYKFYINSM